MNTIRYTLFMLLLMCFIVAPVSFRPQVASAMESESLNSDIPAESSKELKDTTRSESNKELKDSTQSESKKELKDTTPSESLNDDDDK